MTEVETILIGFVVVQTIFAFISFVVSSLIVKRYMSRAIDEVADLFGGILSEPTVKKAFSILGGKSGEARADKAVVDSLATDILNGPQFASLKMGADLIGVDVESYIEKHGAMGTIQGLSQIAGMLGIDINSIIGGGLQAGGSSSSGSSNPFLGGKI
jgi:hypothetical protein